MINTLPVIWVFPAMVRALRCFWKAWPTCRNCTPSRWSRLVSPWYDCTMTTAPMSRDPSFFSLLLYRQFETSEKQQRAGPVCEPLKQFHQIGPTPALLFSTTTFPYKPLKQACNPPCSDSLANKKVSVQQQPRFKPFLAWMLPLALSLMALWRDLGCLTCCRGDLHAWHGHQARRATQCVMWKKVAGREVEKLLQK